MVIIGQDLALYVKTLEEAIGVMQESVDLRVAMLYNDHDAEVSSKGDRIFIREECNGKTAPAIAGLTKTRGHVQVLLNKKNNLTTPVGEG